MGAEDAVEPGEDGGVIAVALKPLGVVPVVEAGRGEQPFERTEAPAHVGVDEEAPETPDDQDQDGDQPVAEAHRVDEAEGEERGQHHEPRPEEVDRVGARADHEVDFLGAVMDRVEAPQQRDLVAQPVRPVVGGLADHHRGRGPRPHRQGGDPAQQSAGNEPVGDHHHHRHRYAEHQAGEESVDEIVAGVDADLLAQDLLLVQREQVARAAQKPRTGSRARPPCEGGWRRRRRDVRSRASLAAVRWRTRADDCLRRGPS